ncbi:MAG: hypothetical protein GTO53_07475 [Planctomycetales bacterium]|nr:hypothetical protein [Planctomycetales bacterium]NIM08976.1 hypothetical protein [Planctomycetales bacterium]NIN08439.1 hypothetical protein [Planctomycetales bacterium]NIN77573.1 hypothetical protein [Planctomycetales bacterium]NIO34738.1 hypothetical protein [Planctomycetales bacterium]
MSLQEKLGEELNRLEAAGTLTAPHQIEIDGQSYQLNCEVHAVGPLGCALSHLTARGDKLAAATVDQLRSVSESLASQLTYLLEPVATIEVDQDGCVVQMRSDPPHREQDDYVYYELLVQPERVSLRRFRKEKQQPRHPVNAHLTREVLIRLASDLVAVVG